MARRVTTIVSGSLVAVIIASLASCSSEEFVDVGSHQGTQRTQGSSPQQLAGGEPQQSKFHVLMPDDTAAGRIAGYRHALTRSKFRPGVGPGPLVVDAAPDGNGVRTTGSAGVFLEYNNGFATGIPNAKADSWSVGPYSDKPEPHAARVLGYFRDAGLEQSQVAGVDTNTWMREGGPTTEFDGKKLIAKNVVAYRELLGYSSVVKRTVGGVLVADSFAWAMFNKNDEVIYEQVWWPDLRASVITEIAAFKARLTDPVFVASLPSGDAPPELVIHHATPTGETWYTAVVYDVRRGPEILHLDLDGKPKELRSWAAATSDSK